MKTPLNLSRKKFFISEAGAAFVEFTLALPLLLLVSLGIYEVTTFIRISAKLNEAAGNIAQWMAIHPSVFNGTDFQVGFNLMGAEFNFSTKGNVMITGLTSSSSASTGYNEAWKYGSSGATTTITVNGSSNVTGAGFTLASGASSLIVVEVTYAYAPFFTYFNSILPTVTLYRVAQSIPQTSISPLSAT